MGHFLQAIVPPFMKPDFWCNIMFSADTRPIITFWSWGKGVGVESGEGN